MDLTTYFETEALEALPFDDVLLPTPVNDNDTPSTMLAAADPYICTVSNVHVT